MRARNIKPGLFKNEILGSADPIYTVIFEGLWCLADREGRLEDRPLRIHAEVNPYRPSESTVQALCWLEQQQFIVRYQVDGAKFIAIGNFLKHQQPHMREAASRIPSPDKSIGCTSTVQARCESSESTGPARLIPDSGFRIPDSGMLIPEPDGAHPKQDPSRMVDGIDIEAFTDWLKSRWPSCGPKANFVQAARSAAGLIGSGKVTQEVLRARVDGYRAWCDGGGVSGPQYATLPQNWMNPNHPDLPAHGWAVDWKPPPTKAQQRQDANISAAERLLAGECLI